MHILLPKMLSVAMAMRCSSCTLLNRAPSIVLVGRARKTTSTSSVSPSCVGLTYAHIYKETFVYLLFLLFPCITWVAFWLYRSTGFILLITNILWTTNSKLLQFDIHRTATNQPEYSLHHWVVWSLVQHHGCHLGVPDHLSHLALSQAAGVII